jgi:hypothetical protein
MSDWWTYSPADLLLFSPRVYYRMLELHNEALWPAQLVMLALGVVLLIMMLHGGTTARRIAGLMLGALWVWVAWSFLWERFATINWTVAYIVPIFVAQGAALALLAARADGHTPAARGVARWAGLALLAATILLYPLVAPALGRPWSAVEVFGLMPDPTAVATLAYLAIGRSSGWLMIVPGLWCALSSETLWLLQAPDFFIPITGGLVAVALRLAGTRLQSMS